MILPSTLPILLEQAKLDLKTTECNTAQGSFERSFCDQAKQVDDPVLRCSSMTCLRLDLSCQGNRAWHNYQECYRVVLLCLWFGANMRCGLICICLTPAGVEGYTISSRWLIGSVITSIIFKQNVRVLRSWECFLLHALRTARPTRLIPKLQRLQASCWTRSLGLILCEWS